MHTPEKSSAGKGARGGAPANAPRPSATSLAASAAPSAAAAGPMTPAAVLTLQRAVGNQAVSRALAQEEHVHGAGCGHGAVQRRAAVETAEAPAEILNEALASSSRPIETGTLKKAQSFYQNDRLSQGRVHTGSLAQRAVAAFGAKAMTVGTHIFFGAGVERDPETAGHEFGHLDKNTRGIAETGTDHGTGAPVTNPGQHSELEAATDGAAFAKGADVAPSVAQRAVRQGAATSAGQGTATQRATVQRMERRPSGDEYEADHSASESDHARDSDGSQERRNRDIQALIEQTERLEPVSFRRRVPVRQRPRALFEDEPGRYTESSSDADVPAQSLPDLPEHERLVELRDLLMHELRKGSKKLKVTFRVDAGSPGGNGGHAWIEITGSNRRRSTTFGFYPRGGGNYQSIAGVRGGVRCPDNSGEGTNHESKDASMADIVKGYRLVHQRVEQGYHFNLHNCSTFAGDVWKAMTGKAIPYEWFTQYGLLGTVIATPQGASEGIEAHQKRRHEQRVERLRPLTDGPLRGVVPVAGPSEEIADRMARGKYSQSSSSQSEDVD